jgi:hypothetical protein
MYFLWTSHVGKDGFTFEESFWHISPFFFWFIIGPLLAHMWREHIIILVKPIPFYTMVGTYFKACTISCTLYGVVLPLIRAAHTHGWSHSLSMAHMFTQKKYYIHGRCTKRILDCCSSLSDGNFILCRNYSLHNKTTFFLQCHCNSSQGCLWVTFQDWLGSKYMSSSYRFQSTENHHDNKACIAGKHISRCSCILRGNRLDGTERESSSSFVAQH